MLKIYVILNQMAVVAIHIGAGYHAPQEEEAFREMLDRIITKLRASLCNGNAALDLVHEGLTLLENDEMTNAGLGSCLTIDGYVEMDALIIDGASGAIGAVGAVSDVRNPSSIAYKLIREQQLSDHILIPTMYYFF